MKILVLDNYDSFTYNLVQYLRELEAGEVLVYRNDEISLDAVADYDVIVLSPGPGLPSESGIMPELIKRYAGEKPILGVCLGHQAICEAFGGSLENLKNVYHGVATPVKVTLTDEKLFEGLPETFDVGRYHSWVTTAEDMPDVLEVTAIDDEGLVMALRHKDFKIRGVQFHPESILTKEGKKILSNFMDLCLS